MEEYTSILKPKSKEEIKKIISSFTEYRIKRGQYSYLQYKTTFYFLGRSFTRWKFIKKLEFNSVFKKICSEYIREFDFNEDKLEYFVKHNPNIKEFFKTNKEEVLKEKAENGDTKYKYLTRPKWPN